MSSSLKALSRGLSILATLASTRLMTISSAFSTPIAAHSYSNWQQINCSLDQLHCDPNICIYYQELDELGLVKMTNQEPSSSAMEKFIKNMQKQATSEGSWLSNLRRLLVCSNWVWWVVYSQQQNYMQQLRRTILADEEIVASRSRLGLFSQPPPLALGDDSQYLAKKANKGEDGKPKTQPRQILAGPNRSGILKKSYIQVPQSINQKDPFKQSFKLQLQYQNTMHRHSPIHQAQFRPVACSRTITNSAFPHQQQKQNPPKKAQRDENGKVKTQPSNFVTNPTSRVEAKLFKHLAHMADPYNRPAEIKKQEQQLWRSKFKHQVMFKSMNHGGKTFSKVKEQFGVDQKTKMIMSQKKQHTFGNVKRVTHDARFKPAVRGHGDPIARFPEYVPPRERRYTEVSKKVKTEAGQDERGDWRPSFNGMSRPTPSVSLMATNVRRYM